MFKKFVQNGVFDKMTNYDLQISKSKLGIHSMYLVTGQSSLAYIRCNIIEEEKILEIIRKELEKIKSKFL
jgi:hypothetical protein